MKSKTVLIATAALATSTAIACIAGLTSIVTGDFGFSYVLERSAAESLATGVSATSLAAAEARSRAALRVSPYENLARAQLVYIDTLRQGHVGPQGARTLQQSYDLIPYDWQLAGWRIKFGLENWSELAPETRLAIKDEAVAFGRAWTRDPDIRGILSSIRDPSGALAAALIRQEIERR